MDLYGYLGRDPEFKKTNNGKEYVQFSVGVSKNMSGAVKTQWYQVKAWKPFDDVARAMKLHKGSAVYIKGHFELQENNGRQYPTVQAIMLEVMGSPKPEVQKPAQSQFNNSYQPNYQTPTQLNEGFNQATLTYDNIKNISDVVVSDEDLPF
jgi:single-strand DNA-binding protein